jgi:hypothetical protein
MFLHVIVVARKAVVTRAAVVIWEAVISKKATRHSNGSGDEGGCKEP